ncbi:MAG: hypothetical protein KBS81_04690, partial [Spirochaetales bacterium]|nr:hypothetical protein [Candidatus Physcosoma equi]
ERICDLAINSSLIGDEGVSQSLNLRQYLFDYWTPGTELFERRTKLKANKHQYSAKKNVDSLLVHVFHSERNTKRNGKVVGYYLPDNLLVSQLTREHCQKLQDSVLLTKELSAKTWLNVLDAMSPPLNRLVKEDVIHRNPFNLIERPSYSRSTSNNRGFERTEVTAICIKSLTLAMEEKMDWKIALAFCLAASTGMRLGEVQALRSDRIEINSFSQFATIKIDKAFALVDGFKEPKSGKTRYVYCPRILAEKLIEIASPSGLIFEGAKTNEPIQQPCLSRNLDSVLFHVDICIPKEGLLIYVNDGRNASCTIKADLSATCCIDLSKVAWGMKNSDPSVILIKEEAVHVFAGYSRTVSVRTDWDEIHHLLFVIGFPLVIDPILLWIWNFKPFASQEREKGIVPTVSDIFSLFLQVFCQIPKERIRTGSFSSTFFIQSKYYPWNIKGTVDTALCFFIVFNIE